MIPVCEDDVLVAMNPVADDAPADGAKDRGVDGQEDRWVVWRQDDNGNLFEVARWESRAEAEALAATMEARGHKQTYRVAAVA